MQVKRARKKSNNGKTNDIRYDKVQKEQYYCNEMTKE